MRWVWLWACLAVLGCSSSPPPPKVKPLFQDGVMQKPLTAKEAERYLVQAAPDFGVCYRIERMNMAPKVSSYVFQVQVPPTGAKPAVAVLSETVPGQTALRDCLILAIQRVAFPKHVGGTLTVRVPIQAD